MSVDTPSENLGVAEEFEDSIKTALNSNENQNEGHSDTDVKMDCPGKMSNKRKQIQRHHSMLSQDVKRGEFSQTHPSRQF